MHPWPLVGNGPLPLVGAKPNPQCMEVACMGGGGGHIGLARAFGPASPRGNQVFD